MTGVSEGTTKRVAKGGNEHAPDTTPCVNSLGGGCTGGRRGKGGVKNPLYKAHARKASKGYVRRN